MFDGTCPGRASTEALTSGLYIRSGSATSVTLALGSCCDWLAIWIIRGRWRSRRRIAVAVGAAIRVFQAHKCARDPIELGRLLLLLDLIHIDARLERLIQTEQHRQPLFELAAQRPGLHVVVLYGLLVEGDHQRFDATETEFDLPPFLAAIEFEA